MDFMQREMERELMRKYEQLPETEKIEKLTGKKVKETIYSSSTIDYDEIVKVIMNRRHLIIIINSSQHRRNEDNDSIIFYLDEKICGFDSYITHLNTKSFMYGEYTGFKQKCKGYLIGSKEENCLISFKYENEEEKEEEELMIIKNYNSRTLITGIPFYSWGDFHYKDILTREINDLKIIQMEGEEEEKEEEEEETKIRKLDWNSLFIVGKYFNTINDYINIEKTCKEYNGILEQYHFNPIPLRDERERELFKNLETYHIYGQNKKDDERELERFKKCHFNNYYIPVPMDERIKTIVHWETKSYSEWKKKNEDKHIYKNVQYGNEEMKEIFSHSERRQVSLHSDITECYLKYTDITIPEGVNSIESYCFANCANLHSINIPSSVVDLGFACFIGCKCKISIDEKNPIYRTDGYNIFRKDTGEKVDVWKGKGYYLLSHMF